MVTKPVAAASKPATYTVSCVAAATTTTPVVLTSDVAGVRRESREIVAEPGQDDGEADAHRR